MTDNHSTGFDRRAVVGGGLALLARAAAPAAVLTAAGAAAPASAQAFAPPAFVFEEIAGGVDEKHHVAAGYDADILVRWGDPILPGAPEFDPMKQTPAAQSGQWGMNNDFIGYIPLNPAGDRGLLCVNHEYSESHMMFPGLGADPVKASLATTAEHVAIEMAAVGGSIIEIAKAGGKWSLVRDSKYNRRITALDTVMAVSGPAAGHARFKTKDDPTGTKIVGTMNDCAGGITPWGTWLLAEENFQGYFWTDERDERGLPKRGLGGAQAASYARYGVPVARNNWGKFVERYNIDKEPNEPNRFGWIVEVDPMDPTSTPVKHTALGRFRHEGAENAIAKDGRVVVYSGDDDRNEFLYKFITKGVYVPADREGAKKLLSEGTLYVAKFAADGTGEWIPMIHGERGLTAENGFASQADVMIDARLAATRLGATPLDRPEDVEPGPGGRVIMALTNNADRKPDQVDAVNPRGPNFFGHIVEMFEDGEDFGARTFKWSILVLCGDPKNPAHGAKWHPETTAAGWFAAPDNVAFDPSGRLWVATDQGTSWGRLTQKADGLFALDYVGEKRGRSRMFFRCPVGAEMCGPRFTPDGETLFLAVQHPSADGTKDWKPFGKDSSFADPATRWPDFKDGMPPRPSLVVITKKGGGKIGF